MIDVVPNIKHIYMYRQAVPFVRSYEKLFAIPTRKENSISKSIKGVVWFRS